MISAFNQIGLFITVQLQNKKLYSSMNFIEQSNYQSMYLQSIPNQKKNKPNPITVSSSLNTADISGARSKFIQKPIKERQTFYNRNDDIEKSRSKRLIPQYTSKKDQQLEIDDISGTRSQAVKFKTTRKTDPLNPLYQLPQVILAEVPQPKFIRDNMEIDDIEGTRPKETFVRLMQRKGKALQKQPMLFSLKDKKLAPKVNNFVMDVSDINNKQKDQIKFRETNPLEPVYKLYTTTSQNRPQSKYGQIQGNKPMNPKAHIQCPDFCLNVKDIDGAIPKKSRYVSSGKQMEVTGSQANSLKRGLSTKRKTNPLEPKYNYLGNQQIKQSIIRPKTAAQRLDMFLQ